MEKVTNQAQTQEKKTWISPEMELISGNDIQSGLAAFYEATTIIGSLS